MAACLVVFLEVSDDSLMGRRGSGGVLGHSSTGQPESRILRFVETTTTDSMSWRELNSDKPPGRNPIRSLLANKPSRAQSEEEYSTRLRHLRQRKTASCPVGPSPYAVIDCKRTAEPCRQLKSKPGTAEWRNGECSEHLTI